MSIVLKKPERPVVLPKEFVERIGAENYIVTQFYDSCVYNHEKEYNTYKITTPDKSFVFKQYGDEVDYEMEVEHFSLLKGLPVPKLLGCAEMSILMEFVEGDDLKNATDKGLRAFAKSLAAIMNAYPMGHEYKKDRQEQYLKRLEKRAACLKDEPELCEAFAIFLERQADIPLTLSNADLLPLNVLYDGNKATIIDWEFGGFMSYPLDIARFIAHYRPNGEVTSFCMAEEKKELFVNRMYDALEKKPVREIFDRDIMLAIFNEYVENLEYYFNHKEEERGAVFTDYYARARELAKIILCLTHVK